MSHSLFSTPWKRGLLAITSVLAFQPAAALACACGCGVFDVGTSSMFPSGAGNMAFFEYDFMDQNQNWNGSSKAEAYGNNDKKLVSHFLTLGDQYMINRSWGVQVELPFTFRNFQTVDPDSGELGSFNHAAFGDLRIWGIYTGFSSDLSTGITYGLRLPTGDFTYAGFDPDTEIGSGSTDLLLGVFHVGAITSDNLLSWFGQANLDQPVLTQNAYLPGSEIDAAAGAYYNGLTWNGGTKLAPLLQVLASLRASDHGGNPAADPLDTGYDRLLVSPGAELDVGKFRFYGDVEFPVYQYLNGMQLVAPELFKAIVSYAF